MKTWLIIKILTAENRLETVISKIRVTRMVASKFKVISSGGTCAYYYYESLTGVSR